MRIEYKKNALKNIIDLVPDELEAIAEAKADTSPTVPHEAINWDYQENCQQWRFFLIKEP